MTWAQFIRRLYVRGEAYLTSTLVIHAPYQKLEMIVAADKLRNGTAVRTLVEISVLPETERDQYVSRYFRSLSDVDLKELVDNVSDFEIQASPPPCPPIC